MSYAYSGRMDDPYARSVQGPERAACACSGSWRTQGHPFSLASITALAATALLAAAVVLLVQGRSRRNARARATALGRRSERAVARLLTVARRERSKIVRSGVGDTETANVLAEVRARTSAPEQPIRLPRASRAELRSLRDTARRRGKAALLVQVLDGEWAAFKLPDDEMWTDPSDLRKRFGEPKWFRLPRSLAAS